ncbi:villin-2-like [Salvia splendens]|uniref:villin-2-like n=1 Tax=Salvia splendens TaxID=180675 RepID=UPI001C25D228|nr:villin-2-like [Salvia splendens]XP_041999576.1 villin-2-like [Salvia splendens]XP_041999577.1 villin-2-like [Salvia splendens]XP_041999578.1 villin-2-like [Salvia splendens]
MSNTAKSLEPAFQGVGQKALEIWRIENFQPVPLPKPDYGKFHTGDSYIVLQTIAGRGGGYHYDVHFWLGKETSQDEAGTAAIKTVELDAVLGGRAVQYRELQGHESDKFLSYFKPCIIPLEGGFASGFKTVEEEEFETRLYTCKGKRVVRMKQVPFSRSSLNHDDIFILDTKNKIYQFNGANSNIQERGKALEVVQFLKDKYHEGTCDVAIVDDGKLKAESDSGEFWVLFGGFAPIGKKVITDDDIVAEKISPQLYSIKGGNANAVEGELSKSLLENNRCYLLDCGNEIFLWVGRVTQVDERKAATQAAEEFVTRQNRPKSTQIIWLIQGHENHAFKSKFDSWPTASTTPVVEEGRGKVAALLKQQGGGVKAATKKAPVIEDIVPPLLEGGGKLEVWRINGNEKTAVPAEDIGKFYSGDCYVVLYTYNQHERKEDFYLCSWIGKDSVQEEVETATTLCNTMYNTLKGRPVQGRIYQGKEPPQFIAIFQPMVTLKGGMSSGYRDHINGGNDETYTGEGVALFRVSGTSLHNNKALQVDAVATSLNSNHCFVLQSGTTVFCWIGNKSCVEQQKLGAKVAEFLKPGSPIKHTKEGTESSIFWGAIGGKMPYTSKKTTPESPRDPHLFSYSFNKEKFEVEEIYRFSQDDLLTEDMLILDTYAEVIVWVGQLVDTKEKKSAFEVGQKYVEMAGSLDGLAPNVPLYKVTEGNEPCFFTTYFSWDPAKASLYGNSFQKKVLQLFGDGNEDKSNASNDGGPTQRASALAALNTAFSSTSSPKPVIAPRAGAGQGSQRAAAVAALSSVLTTEKLSPDSSPGRRLRSPHAESSPTARTPRRREDASAFAEEAKENFEGKDSEPAEPTEETNEEENEQDSSEAVQGTYDYEQLKSKSVPGIDYKRREAYLSEEDFQTVFEMSKEAFYQNPKWKQDLLKKKAELF